MTAALVTAVAVGARVSAWEAGVARAEARRAPEEALHASAEVDRQRAVRDLHVEVMSRLSARAAEDPVRAATFG